LLRSVEIINSTWLEFFVSFFIKTQLHSLELTIIKFKNKKIKKYQPILFFKNIANYQKISKKVQISYQALHPLKIRPNTFGHVGGKNGGQNSGHN